MKLISCQDHFTNPLHRGDTVKFDPSVNDDTTLFTILDMERIDGVNKLKLTYWREADAFYAPANLFYWVSSPRRFISEE